MLRVNARESRRFSHRPALKVELIKQPGSTHGFGAYGVSEAWPTTLVSRH